MNILNLAAANIRKGKGSAISLVVLILLATMLLNVGLGIFMKVKPFFLDKVEEMQGPHAVVIMQSEKYKPAYAEFIKNEAGVLDVEAESMIYMGQANFQMGKGEFGLGAAVLNMDQSRGIAPLALVESWPTPSERSIYIPLPLKEGGYALGDTLTIRYMNMEHSYVVSGYFESTVYGMVNAGTLKFFLPGAAYGELEEQIGTVAGSTMLSVRMEEPEQSSQLLRDFENQTDVELSGGNAIFHTNVTDYAGMSMTSTMMISIFAMLLGAFAWIIVIVALIVIRFRVVNSIEDQMVNIGALGALGYTSRQITASMQVQFMMIGVVGALLGTGFSYAVSPLINSLLSSLAGLGWKRGFQPGLDIVSLLLVLALVLLVTWLASRGIKNLPPVVALRGGIRTHSFRKNHVPLDKSRGGLQVLLALKSLASNMKQNVIVAVIMAGVTFASVFSVIMYYNLSVDKNALYNMFGSEMSDVIVHAHPDTDTEALFADLALLPDVQKTNKLDIAVLNLEGEEMAVFFSDDYRAMENLAAYKGRMPQYENEVVITGVMSDLLNRGIGDTVEVKMAGKSGKYLVTGLTQTMNNGGRVAFTTLAGMQQLSPDYEIGSLHLYLDGSVAVDDFIAQLRRDFAGRISLLENYRELGDAQMSTYSSAITSLMTVVLLVTMIVVSLILYLVIQTVILKRKRDFGIYKAMGYTSFQLMTQIALSFVPVVALGVFLGGVLGSFGTNPLLSMLLYNVGVSNAIFKVHIPSMMLLCVAIVLFAYVISIFAARRIRKISAYGLIVE
ncbi:hypothetical protein JCM10914A_23700 [Paenibacillus sp. JCM 10914]|uniref:ABC transporter permease n=1 Tax=Paenibacillus sp. JCM 10914 TaxID=1236974 RepID=UPI0003CC5433|nr:ABC transporter permease [Paenibacillus sp. JCM 10914]GAE06032.1 hypothetical protein JCM10914_2171 [Paenibacillus sp. JCM 10914]